MIWPDIVISMAHLIHSWDGMQGGFVKTGDFNTYLGIYSGQFGSGGEYNVALGVKAGEFTKGSRNIFIGQVAPLYVGQCSERATGDH